MVRLPACSGRPPDASATVAGRHDQPDGELDDTNQPLKDDIPARTRGSQDSRELQDGHRYPQHASKERDQDQPEGPAPPVMTTHKLQVAQEMFASGQYTVAAIAKTLGVSRASIYRHLGPPRRLA
jgi:hypothetical protein